MPGKASKPFTSMVDRVKHVVADGWASVLTGIGSIGGDKTKSSSISYSLMSEMVAEQLYAGSDVAARIIESEPEDALRQWFTLTSTVENLSAEIDKKLDEVHASTRLFEAWCWGRLYGGAALLICVDDSKTFDQPLDLKDIRELKALTVLTRYELMPGDIDIDLNSPRFGEPIFYHFRPKTGGGVNDQQKGDAIHHTRLLTFEGARLPYRQRQQNQYWGDSILNRAQNSIRNYEVTNDAVAVIMQEFNQGIFKMKGLADLILAGKEDLVQKRLQTIQLSRSVTRAVIVDADSESFENVAAHLTGVPEMVRTVEKRLVVASKMPHTKILGESPSGLGATGESEQEDWDDHISNQQELILRPKIHRLISIILASKYGPTKGVDNGEWSFEFNPLKQPSENDTIERRKKQAEIDKLYIEYSVVDPNEVRRSRFGSGKYSHDTIIESDTLEAARNKDDPEDDNKDDDKQGGN